MRSFWVFMTKQHGREYWSVFLWATAVAGLVGIPLVHFFPSTVPYVWLWLVGIPANSPVAPLFPTAFEPFMLEVVKYRPVLSVALVATAIFVYMEFVNWYAFSWILNWDRLERVRDHRWVKWGRKRFARAPYRTVFFFAATPLPFWVARSLAVLNKLKFWPYLAVMAVGRFPRMLFYAWFGTQVKLPTVVLVSIAVGTGLVLIGWRMVRRKPVMDASILDVPNGRDRGAPGVAGTSSAVVVDDVA